MSNFKIFDKRFLFYSFILFSFCFVLYSYCPPILSFFSTAIVFLLSSCSFFPCCCILMVLSNSTILFHCSCFLVVLLFLCSFPWFLSSYCILILSFLFTAVFPVLIPCHPFQSVQLPLSRTALCVEASTPQLE